MNCHPGTHCMRCMRSGISHLLQQHTFSLSMFADPDTLLSLGLRFIPLGGDGLGVAEGVVVAVVLLLELLPPGDPGGNCIKIGLPGKSILRDYSQENMTSRRPFLLLRIRFPGRPIFIQFVPGVEVADTRRKGLRRVLRGRVQHEFGEAWQRWRSSCIAVKCNS